MNSVHEARIPEYLDSFVLGLAWFLFFLIAYCGLRWLLSRFRRRPQPQTSPGPVHVTVFHHHVIEIRRAPEADAPRSRSGSDRDL